MGSTILLQREDVDGTQLMSNSSGQNSNRDSPAVGFKDDSASGGMGYLPAAGVFARPGSALKAPAGSSAQNSPMTSARGRSPMGITTAGVSRVESQEGPTGSADEQQR